MATIIGIVGMVIGIAGVTIAWIALTKVQALSVMFVKAHIQGLRTETAKNSAAINTIINKLAVIEKSKSSASMNEKDDSKEDLAPPSSSTH
jgi:xanthosine utilization system XapX-like protein